MKLTLEDIDFRLRQLEYAQQRKKCSEGHHTGERQIIESTDRIWVRCETCYGDLSESINIKKPI